jgi:hypothetical protein
MGKRDTISAHYLEDKERVADLLNVVLLHGQRLIRPEDIEDCGTVNRIVLPAQAAGGLAADGSVEDKEYSAKYRDILLKAVLGCRAILIGIENQDKIHYAMPLRAMGYDYGQYASQYEAISKQHRQLEDLKAPAEYLSGFGASDFLTAVFTIVVYYGEEPWHGPRCLKDMLNLEEIPEELKGCINDYPLHIIEAVRFEDPELFETDLKLVFGCLRYQSQPEAFKEFLEAHREEFQKLESDAYDMIAAYGHAKQLKQVKEVLVSTKREEEGVDMCKAIDELERQAWEKGKAEGREEGLFLGEK